MSIMSKVICQSLFSSFTFNKTTHLGTAMDSIRIKYDLTTIYESSIQYRRTISPFRHTGVYKNKFVYFQPIYRLKEFP